MAIDSAFHGDEAFHRARAAEIFRFDHYTVRRKVFQLFGATFYIYDPNGKVAFYSRQKAFRLREDIRLYTGQDMQTEVLAMKARNIIDFSATYDVLDSQLGTKVGSLRRRGLKSMLRDTWEFYNVQDRLIGTIEEDNLLAALVRRTIFNLLPQSFTGRVGGQVVCYFRQNFNPFVQKIRLDFSPDTQGLLDRRLGIAAAVLLCAIEGRQQ